MADNVVLDKSFDFALRISKLYRHLVDVKKEFLLSKELLIAGRFYDRIWRCATQGV